MCMTMHGPCNDAESESRSQQTRIIHVHHASRMGTMFILGYGLLVLDIPIG